ncbi:MAG: lipid kinase, partial [candidate division GAL15 bacterium]
RGAHLGHPKVARAAAREVVVDASIPLAVHADGEPVGTTPARFRVQPGALEVLAP